MEWNGFYAASSKAVSIHRHLKGPLLVTLPPKNDYSYISFPPTPFILSTISRGVVIATPTPPFERQRQELDSAVSAAVMSWLFLDWFVPLYLLVSVLVLAGFGACLYFLEPGLQDAHKWSNKTVRHHPLVASVNCRDDDSNALI
ncbi:hypothetical protein EPR50_G00016250 [Perca flavescens]|uniref:Uncharacterized protein n=11 Tax=Euacanthomorphacea TaxID=123369 RepID=A0A484DKQ1_PERFV|nr:hypothetical protein EPR50_G00016250 [Perca flavescens]